jgi:sugar phosphate isomerase/epimerase
MEAYKDTFPFKLGTTSYILPVKEDNLLTNIRFLRDRFDLIQLLFMGREYLHEIMSPSIIKDLKAIRDESRVSFTVHLPADLDLLNSSEDKINASIDVIEHIMAETGPLNIEGYVLHVDRFVEGSARADLDQREYHNFRTTLDSISMRMGGEAKNIYIENTTYDLVYFKDILLASPFPICMDAGHLFFFGQDYDTFINIFSSRIRQIHLHGYRDGKDHKAITELEGSALHKIIDFQVNYSCPMILEVFNLDDLVQSAEYLKSFY